MIRRISDDAQIRVRCLLLNGQPVFIREAVFGRKVLAGTCQPVPTEVDGVCELITEINQASQEESAQLQEFSQATLGKYVPGDDIHERCRRQHELDVKHGQIRSHWAQRRTQALRALETRIASMRPPDMMLVSSGDTHYAVYRGSVWCSHRKFAPEEWLGLIAEKVRHEEARLAAAMSLCSCKTDRPTIPSTVRTAVWNRDGGQCVRCGSRERLEFDHIIPLALGGSNTARNIELLCETCNRSKGATIT